MKSTDFKNFTSLTNSEIKKVSGGYLGETYSHGGIIPTVVLEQPINILEPPKPRTPNPKEKL